MSASGGASAWRPIAGRGTDRGASGDVGTASRATTLPACHPEPATLDAEVTVAWGDRAMG